MLVYAHGERELKANAEARQADARRTAYVQFEASFESFKNASKAVRNYLQATATERLNQWNRQYIPARQNLWQTEAAAKLVASEENIKLLEWSHSKSEQVDTLLWRAFNGWEPLNSNQFDNELGACDDAVKELMKNARDEVL
ncbi:hypothetical protein ACH4ZX_05885 [Streptomyces sp. NPDC020490]|uniref:hypothetical protein n=1 Tax=Streptomyces sp. NPDC020490 TaxID=3365078 RepID=UPI00379E1296